MPGQYWFKKQQERNHQAHRFRVENAKCTIDTAPPRTMGDSKNRKREIERHRAYAKIEKENRLLLERLSKAMQEKNIDNVNVKATRFRRSLMQTQRKLELQRITQENQRLLRRIQETEPCYSHVEWEQSAKKHDAYLRHMCEFPVPTSTKKKLTYKSSSVVPL